MMPGREVGMPAKICVCISTAALDQGILTETLCICEDLPTRRNLKSRSNKLGMAGEASREARMGGGGGGHRISREQLFHFSEPPEVLPAVSVIPGSAEFQCPKGRQLHTLISKSSVTL